MSEPPTLDRLPGPVTAARVIMFVQAGLGLAAMLFLYNLLGRVTIPFDAYVVVILVLGVVSLVVLGVLGFAASSRRRWVRIAAFVVEGLIGAGSVYGMLADGAVSSSALYGLGLPAVVIVLLARPVSAAWFDR